MGERYGHPGSGIVSRTAALLLAALCALCLATAPVLAASASFEFTLQAEDGRKVPVLVTHPPADNIEYPLIVFSHGAFATPERYTRLLDAWADGGYVVVAPMHVDSELNPDRDQYDRDATMRTRLEDFGLLVTGRELRSVLDAAGLQVSGEVIAAGHSYGGLIAQIAGGARLPGVAMLPEPLLAAQNAINSVVALSPPGPFPGSVQKEDWSFVKWPMLVVTGTTDILPGFVDDWQMHLVSYDAAQEHPAYALVFADQDHYFNGAFGRPKDTLEPSTVRALDALNLATLRFMDALLDGALPTKREWEAQSGDVFEARASAATAH